MLKSSELESVKKWPGIAVVLDQEAGGLCRFGPLGPLLGKNERVNFRYMG